MSGQEERIGQILIDCAIKIHKSLGPGLLESCYETCLYHDLIKQGLKVERQKNLPIIYDGYILESGYRLDLLIEEKVIVELKSVDTLTNIHTAQILTYMRLGGFRLGYLLNFNEVLMKNGIKRFVI